YSLYGESRKPDKEMLDSVDVIIFDHQDIGTRYYTFIYTIAYVMEACMEGGKHFVVLDRPNAISGNCVEGNLVEDDVRSIVCLLPNPYRHGMTVGELSQLLIYEFDYNCELTIVAMKGSSRHMYYHEAHLFSVPPTPNAIYIDMNILHTGTCLGEGT